MGGAGVSLSAPFPWFGMATMAGVVPVEVHECGWQWRPTDKNTAFAPPFGTIRQCRVCGCLVAGGPTACARCAKAGA